MSQASRRGVRIGSDSITVRRLNRQSQRTQHKVACFNLQPAVPKTGTVLPLLSRGFEGISADS